VAPHGSGQPLEVFDAELPPAWWRLLDRALVVHFPLVETKS
jgi:hypothetical protein